VASRTQIVCLCEGKKGESIDEVFINRLIKSLKPAWIRQDGSNVVRFVQCGGRKTVIERTPSELQRCLELGGHTTLMVWADCDDDCADCDELKTHFWKEAQRQAITREQFDQVVFIFAKDRLENWIEFLNAGKTNESVEGPRVKHNREVAEAAKRLAELCNAGKRVDHFPQSLRWSCANWKALAERMK
jgi:hypothetical protein